MVSEFRDSREVQDVACWGAYIGIAEMNEKGSSLTCVERKSGCCQVLLLGLGGGFFSLEIPK